MGFNDLIIEIKDSYEQAPNYNQVQVPGFKGATLVKAVIVRKGTTGGRDTVDLQFRDEKGNIYVTMITARLLKQVTDLCIV